MPSISVSRKELKAIEWLLRQVESGVESMPNGIQKNLKRQDFIECKEIMDRFKIKYDGGMMTDIKKYQKRLAEQKK